MSSIGIANKVHLGPDLEHYLAVCSGEFCAVCDAPMRAAGETLRGMRLCADCWPDTAVPWTRLHASIMWSPEEWTLCICYPTTDQAGARISVWLMLHDRAECNAILQRYLCRRSDLLEFEELPDHAGHITISMFVGPKRLMALAEATRRDPRNGYQKRADLQKRGR